MAKYITFGTIDRSLLYIVLTSVALVINQYIYGFTYIECFYQMNIYRTFYELIIGEVESDENKNKVKFLRHRVFDPLFSYAGVIILSFIFIKKRKPTDLNNISLENIENEATRKSEIKLIYNGKKKYFHHLSGILFYVLILFLWIAEENLVLIYVDIFQDLDFWFFELIFVSIIFSKIFIFKISSHQILGVAISVLVGSILKIYNITITFNSLKDTYYVKNPGVIAFSLLYFLLIALRSYVHSQIKAFLDLKYISHRFLMITYGIAGTFLCFITGIITTNAACPDNDFFRGHVCRFEENTKLYYDNWYTYYVSGKNLGVRLIIIVFGFVSYFVNKYYLTLTIKNYTPIHVIFSFPIQFFIEKNFLLIYTAIFHRADLFKKSTDVKKFLLDVSGDIGSIIGFLIYLEIIELNFCGFNFNLKKNIIQRSESDYVQSLAATMIPLDDNFEDSEDEDDDSNDNSNDNSKDKSNDNTNDNSNDNKNNDDKKDNNNKDYNNIDNNINYTSVKKDINDS